MKTLCLSLLFAVAIGTGHVSAQAVAAAASPLPATESEPAAGTKCPDCQMDHCPPCNDGKDAAKAGTDDKNQANTEKTVLELETKWCEAEARHDVAFLEKVEADGFTFTDSTGKLTTKKDEVEEAKQGGEKIEFKLSDMKAHVYGDAVILTGQTSFNTADTGSAPDAYRWTDVFVRQANGEWQVVASQATALGQGKIAVGSQSE